MYLRWTSFPLQAGHRAEIETTLAPFRQRVAEQPGFVEMLVAFDAPATRLITITTWESHADAEAITRTVRDAVQRELGELLSDDPITEIFEISTGESVAADDVEPLT